MSNDPRESPGSTRPRLIHPSVLTQMQIERLKKEDEEEHWISGEELCTEGSSDDDDDRRFIGGAVDPELIRHADSIRSNYCRHPAAGRSRRGAGSQIRDRRKVKIDETDSDFASAAVEPETSSSSSSAELDRGTEKNPRKSDGAGDREDADKDREISWRPKRDDSDCEAISGLDDSSAIVELRELQFEYGDILDSISELKTSLKPSNRSWNSDDSRERDGGDNCENEIDARLLTAVNGADVIMDEDDDVSVNEDLARWSKAVINTDKIEKAISKVVELDTRIGEIRDKVRKAGEETLREEITNRKKLRKMRSRGAPETGELAKNSRRFFELCNSVETDSGCTTAAESDEFLKDLKKELEIGSGDEGEEFAESESRQSQREKLEEKLTLIEKRKANFIERNKQLASCAMGTLAITDEEKKRLEELLEDVDDEECGNDRESVTSFSTVVSTPYTIDKEADELLKELTEQLSDINSETYRKSVEEARYSREEFLPQREQVVMSSLRDLAESGSKAIYPISEEEVRRLISEYHAEQEAREFSKDFEPSELSCSNLSSTTGKTPTIAYTVIEELIEEAKTRMPLFQFKYPTEEPLMGEDESEKRSA